MQIQFNSESLKETQDLMECRGLGFWCQDRHGPHPRFGSFCPCDENDPGAMPDKNRLAWFKQKGKDDLYEGCTRVPRGVYDTQTGAMKR